MITRTKIICTMGPSVNHYEKILELIDAGMNVARLNFSHGSHEDHLKTIQLLKKAREEKKVPLAIMLDTKGPEIRVGKIKNDLLPLQPKQVLKLVKEAIEGNEHGVQITPMQVFDSIKVGMKVLFDDGYIISRVVDVQQDVISVEILNLGQLKSNKGVNIPNAEIDLPAMTEQDIADIKFGCKHDVDAIAASFIRSADHVIEIKRLLVKQGKADTVVIAKIENMQGVQNFDSILQVADGIMVARGDLGVELPLEEVPGLQKMMIRKSYCAGKPVVTATQMLESMIKNPRPTRAEVSDVANAIYDSTSAVMLSGETAVGAYPIDTVRIMKSIVRESERNFNFREFFESDPLLDSQDVSSSVALATVKTAYSTAAKAIFAFTHGGSTARLISKCRPEMAIIALSPNIKTYHQLSFSWGVIPVDPMPCKNIQEALSTVSHFSLERGFVRYGDLVVVTAGSPFGISGTTNMMIVESIGDVLVRGRPGIGNQIHGKVVFAQAPEKALEQGVRECILVITQSNDQYLPLMKHAIGIVLENHPDDTASEKHVLMVAKTLGIPTITRASRAMSLLQEGQLVTLDPPKGIVYKGSISSTKEGLPK